MYLQEDFYRREQVMDHFFLHNIAFYQIYMLYPQDWIELIENHYDAPMHLMLVYTYTRNKTNFQDNIYI